MKKTTRTIALVAGAVVAVGGIATVAVATTTSGAPEGATALWAEEIQGARWLAAEVPATECKEGNLIRPAVTVTLRDPEYTNDDTSPCIGAAAWEDVSAWLADSDCAVADIWSAAMPETDTTLIKFKCADQQAAGAKSAGYTVTTNGKREHGRLVLTARLSEVECGTAPGIQPASMTRHCYSAEAAEAYTRYLRGVGCTPVSVIDTWEGTGMLRTVQCQRADGR